MSSYRREILDNKQVVSDILYTDEVEEVRNFHASLPKYKPTPLRPLPELARELGLGRVLVKDESNRFGLPSFKVLGASWGTFKAVTSKLNLPLNTSVDALREILVKHPIELYAATDGNHGQAVAHVAALLGIRSSIFVPHACEQHVRDSISNEGATVIEVTGAYDHTVNHACRKAKEEGALLVQDTSWEGYEDIPRWIVQGYSTIFTEMSEQAGGSWSENTIVITPVGVGSLAHAVVQNCKTQRMLSKIITVEPDTAACLYQSMRTGKLTSVQTSFTIMTGMDCGSVSYTALSALQKHVDACVTVSDYESHEAVQCFKQLGVQSGPCGAAGLAALRRLVQEKRISSDATVILLNTESYRPYQKPFDVSIDDPVELTQILTRIESTNTTLSSAPGTGERPIADYVEAWLQHRDIITHRLAKNPARPSIVGVVEGCGGGKTFMINGHIDTVSLEGYASYPLGGAREIRHGEEVITGRGALDMKAGVAIGMCNLGRAKSQKLNGRLVLSAVADEEDASLGTEELLAAGWRADGAIIPEPTQMELITAHKGFVWLEVIILGKAAHGSDADTGVDAILNSGYFLEGLREYARRLPSDALLGQSTLHCGTVKGGQENSSYPASCCVTIEFRTVPGQSDESILGDVKCILHTISQQHADFAYAEPKITFTRPYFTLPTQHELVEKTIAAGQQSSNRKLVPRSAPSWCDAALLGEKGIPAVILGPSGEGLHGKDEFVNIASIKEVDRILGYLISDFCG